MAYIMHILYETYARVEQGKRKWISNPSNYCTSFFKNSRNV